MSPAMRLQKTRQPVEREFMNRPILAALGAFTGSSLAVLATSYLKHGEFAYGHAIALGVGMALAMYVVAQWKQQKTESQSESQEP